MNEPVTGTPAALPDPILPACGCCDDGRHGLAPIENRPGLPELAYRIGTHGRFKATMLGRLAARPELGALSTRSDDDPSIALVDAWATVLDVLTFYQERIANEGYLRTATERLSVFELAAEIGYEPRPGVAASGPLSFELETGAGAPVAVDIAAGVKVQSVPGPGETPQLFETIEAILARPSWNRIRAHAAERRAPRAGDREAWLAGTATNLRPGDAILFVGRVRDEDEGSADWDVRTLTAVSPDPAAGATRVAWADGLGWGASSTGPDAAAAEIRCYALRQRASLFGAAAPDYATLPDSLKTQAGGLVDRAFIKVLVTGFEWPGLTIGEIAADEDCPDRTLFLDAIYPRLVAGGWLVLQRPGAVALYRPDPYLGAAAVADDARTGFTLSAKSTRVVVARKNPLDPFDDHVRDTVVLLASEELPLAATPIRDPVAGRTVDVDDPLDGFTLGRTVIVEGPQACLEVRDRAHPTLTPDGGAPVPLLPRDVLTVLAGPVAAGGVLRWTVRTAAGDVGVVEDEVGNEALVPVPAPDGAARIAEARVVDLLVPVEGDPAVVTLRFSESLAYAYDRRATVVHGNVAAATHGETKREILGSGDGSAAYQAFALKQRPLTWVPAPTISGSATTLAVDVDDVRWSQAPGLDALGPRDRDYVAATADDGTTTVRFGDGRLGARLPPGVENIRATYRVGIGTVGNLDAGRLTLLMTRPLGTRGVTNPLATLGGDDPETRDRARENAPRTVLAFDRVVSVSDAADVARSFAGIEKSEARWTWDGTRRVVLLTVAGPGGLPVPDVPTLRDLRAAILDAGDPHLPVRLLSYAPLTFDVDLGLFVAGDHDPKLVSAAVRAALLDAFSFARRDLAQPVSVSEVGTVAQGVDGVVAVDLDADGIRVTGGAPPVGPVLLAHGGRASGTGPMPAELLTVNAADGGIRIGIRS